MSKAKTVISMLDEMSQTSKVSGTATKVYKADGYTKIKYHDTDVVSFNDDEIILNTGGWKTATTKARMTQASNQFNLGYDIYQKDRRWYVKYRGETIPFDDHKLKLKR